MFGRIFVSFMVGAIISAILFGILTTLFPQTLTVLEPVLCESYETMEVDTRRQFDNSFTIDAVCTGDGERDLGDMQVFGLMFLVYLIPISTILWLNAATSRKPATQTAVPMGQMSGWIKTGMPSISVNVTSADPKAAEEMAALVKEALKDGVITSDEFQQIQAKANAIASKHSGDADVQSMQSLTERLSELRDAYAQSLITKEEYDSKRREILNNS